MNKEIYAAVAASPRKAIEIVITGSKIAETRERMKMSQEHLAAELEVDVRTVRRWEARGAGRLVELAICELTRRY